MTTPFYCDMNALTPDQRRRHGELAAVLRPAVDDFRELSNGYEARLSADLSAELSEFCRLELLCCPFFRLEIIQREGASVLSITGEGDIKPFIRAEFGIPAPR